LLTGFLLISGNRQAAHADARAELDYEVNVRSYRTLRDVEVLLDELNARIDALARVR